MKRSVIYPILLLLLGTCLCLHAQSRTDKEFRKAYVAPEELISLSKTMSFNQVFNVFYDLSKKYTGKIIVSEVPLNFEIGIDIDKMHWLDALEAILRHNDLWYEELDDYLNIVRLRENLTPEQKADPNAITIDTREVSLSAIFFEADGSKLAQMGFSWDFFRGKGVNVFATNTSADGKPSFLEIQAEPDLDFASILAIFKALESDQVGEVIANPQITVRSGVKGRIQVGSDFSVVTKDFAGNAINQFFSTGSIVEVTPRVISYDTTAFIHLELKIERSSASRSDNGAEIAKSQAETSVLMLDGEESIIGGLNITEETSAREGVPFLKDLPWWFFGLRYLFGFTEDKMVKKELMIVIKVELVPTLSERLRYRKVGLKERYLQQKRRENQLKMRYYEEQLKSKK